MSDEKKIIVDEDWKTRVAAEKEELERQQHAPAGAAGNAASSPRADLPPLPAASFELLVTTLITEAMIGLGQLPHPMTQELHRDVEQARYAIDMLEVLAEKTKGNLTLLEDRFLRDTLHQLRMAFVAVSGQASGSGPGGEAPASVGDN